MKMIQKICSHALTCFCIVIVLLASSLVLPKLLGFKSYIVLSGSMYPEIHTGAFAYVKPQEADTLKVNDIITFTIGENTVTHRINEITDEGFITKGDANEMEDNKPVVEDAIVGQVKFTIPKLGFFITYIQQPPGTYIAISVAAMLLLLIILPDLIFQSEKKLKRSEDIQ